MGSSNSDVGFKSLQNFNILLKKTTTKYIAFLTLYGARHRIIYKMAF